MTSALDLRWSKFLSAVALVVLVALWLQSVVLLARVLEHGEKHLTGDTKPSYTLAFLAITAPALAISSMASPLMTVVRAIAKGSPNHGLQWRLFLGFAVPSVLGLAYGFRQELGSVMASSVAGLSLQCISLGGVYHLSPETNQAADFLATKVLPHHLHATRLSSCVRWLFKWTLYFILLVSAASSIFAFACWLPLETCLAPLYGTSCVFPYIATFSTFPRDIRSWRIWSRLPIGHPTRNAGPLGVDIVTLWFMQVNNMLWSMYGVLILDPAILGSAICSVIAAGVQLVVYLSPLLEVKWVGWALDTVETPKGIVCKPRVRLVRIDPAYLFVGTDWFADLDSNVSVSPNRPLSIATTAAPAAAPAEVYPLTTSDPQDAIEMSAAWYDPRVSQTEPAKPWRQPPADIIGESGGPSPYQHEDSTSHIGGPGWEWGSLQSRGVEGRD